LPGFVTQKPQDSVTCVTGFGLPNSLSEARSAPSEKSLILPQMTISLEPMLLGKSRLGTILRGQIIASVGWLSAQTH
jgi:hypothetical protein